MKNTKMFLIILLLIYTASHQRDNITELDFAKTKGVLFLGGDDSLSYEFHYETAVSDKFPIVYLI